MTISGLFTRLSSGLICISLVGSALAQGPSGPPTRRHTVTESAGKPALLPASQQPAVRGQVSITVEGNTRVIRANGVPDHPTGTFPNRGNPHRIEAQRYVYSIPARPEMASQATPLGRHNFGIAVNGVPFDPGAAEWYLGNSRGGWQYEALSGAVALGIDANHAHVQPTGAYHYHGLPTQLLRDLGVDAASHSPLVGWAADGFPIYAVYGHSDPRDSASKTQPMASSYRLKAGQRPRGRDQPGGKYDGTFVADYEFVEGHGDLDPCNGRFTVTPEFPNGTYAYFLTESWPVIPRCYRGTPSEDFKRRGGPGRRRGGPP